LANFGAFVELVPGKDGLLRTEEMASSDNGVTMGEEITVMIQEVDSMGRINLSRRPLFGEESNPRPVSDRPARPPSGQGPRNRGPYRGSGDLGQRRERRGYGGGGGGYRPRPNI